MMILATLLMACSAPGDALFADLAKWPPQAKPETIDAIKADRPVAEWVAYQGGLCKIHGCIR